MRQGFPPAGASILAERLMVNLVKLILQRPYPDEMEPDVRVIHTTHDLEDKIVCDYMKMGWRVETREEV